MKKHCLADSIMDSLVEEVVPHVDRVLNNPKYHIRTKQTFLDDLISILLVKKDELELEADKTDLLEYPDEMH